MGPVYRKSLRIEYIDTAAAVDIKDRQSLVSRDRPYRIIVLPARVAPPVHKRIFYRGSSLTPAYLMKCDAAYLSFRIRRMYLIDHQCIRIREISDIAFVNRPCSVIITYRIISEQIIYTHIDYDYIRLGTVRGSKITYPPAARSGPAGYHILRLSADCTARIRCIRTKMRMRITYHLHPPGILNLFDTAVLRIKHSVIQRDITFERRYTVPKHRNLLTLE